VACCFVQSTAHRIACLSSGNGFARTGGYRPELPNRWAPALCGLPWYCIFVSPPPGKRCGRGWSQLAAGWGALGGCLLARLGGGNGPAAGALIAAAGSPNSSTTQRAQGLARHKQGTSRVGSKSVVKLFVAATAGCAPAGHQQPSFCV
jgi:hypothetical protein